MTESEEKKSRQESSNSQSAAPAGLPAQYKVVKLIGQGGMGQVFMVHDLHLNRDLALKIFAFSGASEEEMRTRFLQEARVLSSLDHANILKVLGWGFCDDGRPYTLMEYLEGNSLADEIGAGKRLSSSRFREIFSQVLGGLAYAHQQKLVHRDLKPSNIFVCKEKEDSFVKIIDFGIVRYQADAMPDKTAMTRTNMILGSPAYMSPEQCKGALVDQRSDIYSLAVIMYEALKGEPPFQAGSPMELMYKHMSAPAPTLETPGQDPAFKRLAKLIDSCLSKDPSERPQTVEEISSEFEQIFKEQLDTAKLFSQLSGSRPAKPKGLLLGAAGFIMLLLLFIWSFQKHFQNQADRSIETAEKALVKKLEQLELRLHKLQKSYLTSSGQLRVEAAGRIVPALIEKAQCQTELKDLSSADRSLNEALSYCAECDRSSQGPRTKVYLNYARVKMAENQLPLAEKYLRNGLACVNLDNQFDAVIQSELAQELAELLIKRQDYKAAMEPLSRLTDLQAGTRLFKVFQCLQNSKIESGKELAALKLYTHINIYFLAHEKALSEQSATAICKLLEKIPRSQLASDADFAFRVYEQLSYFEKERGNLKEAAEYAKIGATFK